MLRALICTLLIGFAGLVACAADEVEQARAEFRAGLEADRAGDTAAALAHWTAALMSLQRVPGTEALQAGCLYNLGTAQTRIGQPAAGLQRLSEALDLYRRVPNTTWEQAQCLQAAGDARGQLKDSAGQEASCEQALGLYRQVPQTEREQLQCLLTLGVLAGTRGQHQRQIEWLEQAVELCRKTPGTESLQIDALRDLGVAYGRLGDLERKIALTQEALRLAEGQPNSARMQAEVLQNLGSAYCEAGLSQRSVDTTFRALKLYQSLPDTARQQASCLQNLGAAYGDLDDPAGELQAYQQALTLYQTVPETALEQASCHSNTGIALLRAGRNEEALNSLRQSEASLREMARVLTAAGATWLPENLYKVEAGLGEALRRRGQPGDHFASYRYFARAVSLLEQLRARAATTPALRAGHFGQRSWVHDRLLELLLEMRRKGLPLVPQELGETEPSFWADFGMPVPSLWQGWSSYEEAILHFSDSARARVLGDCLLAFTALSPDSRAPSPWAELADLTDREALLTSRLLNAPSSPAQQLALRTELQEVSARRHRAEMAWSDTLFARPLSPHVITLDSLRRSLPTSGALLELKLLRGRLLAILVTRDVLSLHETSTLSAGAGDELFTGQVRELVGEQVLRRLHQARLRAGETAGLPPDTEGLLTPQELATEFTLEELVWLLRQPMEALGKGTESQRTEAMAWQDQQLRVAAALYDLILRPVEEELQQAGAATVAVVPDGPLCYLPFGSLVTTFAPEVDEAPAGRVFAAPSVQFAVERWAFSVLPSVTVYQTLQESWATRPAPSPNLCAFADPVLTLADARSRTRDWPITTPRALAFSPASLDSLPPLPGTRLEAQAALSAAPGPASLYETPEQVRWQGNLGLLSWAASPALLRAPELDRFGFLLFATHCVLYPDRPQHSFLALTNPGLRAPQASPAPDGDGRIYAPAILGLRLKARMVTLSACDTAQGAYARGEGILGLAAAFMLAGSQAVTATLWGVPDEATADLVGRYHALLLRGADPPLALCEAQRAFLRQARAAYQRAPDSAAARYAHPYYWAAFSLLGS